MSARTRTAPRPADQTKKLVTMDAFAQLATLAQESIFALGKANDFLSARVAKLEGIILDAKRIQTEREAGTSGLVTLSNPEIIT